MANNISGQIAARLLNHSVDLLRYNNSLTQDIVGYLNTEIYPDLIALLTKRLALLQARGYDLGPATTARLAALVDQIQTLLDNGYGALQNTFDGEIGGLAAQEAKFNVGLLNGMLPIDVVTPAPALLEALTIDQPFNGSPLGDWFNGLADDDATRVLRTLRSGMALGQTNDEIIQALRGTAAANFTDGVFDIGRRAAAMLVRTATRHIATLAREAVYQSNKDILDSVQWVATLDDKTCEQCGDLDGQTFPVNSGPRPPSPHPDCRCDMIPVIKSWQALGIKADELPASTRASMDGQVPETTSYNDWLKGQSAARQDDILGQVKGAMFRAGNLDIGNFVADGKILTLADLADAEPSIYAAAVKAVKG